MLKLYSKNCEHALRLLTQIPQDNLSQKFQAAVMAKSADLSVHSAKKILQSLVEIKLLQAVPGPGGGYQFRVDPRKITLLDLITAIDGKDNFDHCIMGLSQCNSRNACPAHPLWRKIKTDMLQILSIKTVFDLMPRSDRKGKHEKK